MDIELYDKEKKRLYSILRLIARVERDVIKSGQELTKLGIIRSPIDDEIMECRRKIVDADYAVCCLRDKMDKAVFDEWLAELDESLTKKGE